MPYELIFEPKEECQCELPSIYEFHVGSVIRCLVCGKKHGLFEDTGTLFWVHLTDIEARDYMGSKSV